MNLFPSFGPDLGRYITQFLTPAELCKMFPNKIIRKVAKKVNWQFYDKKYPGYIDR